MWRKPGWKKFMRHDAFRVCCSVHVQLAQLVPRALPWYPLLDKRPVQLQALCFMRIFSELMFAELKTRRRISRSLWMNMRTSNRRPWRQKLIENIPKVGFVEFVGFPPRPTPKPFINLMWMKAQDSVTFSVENGLNGFWIDRKCRRDWRILRLFFRARLTQSVDRATI